MTQLVLKRLVDIKELKNVHDVRVFLGWCVVYYRFIRSYATLEEPLIALTRSGVPWRWTEVERRALENLKEATFLSIPDSRYPFRIRINIFPSSKGITLLAIESCILYFWGSKNFDGASMEERCS